MASDLELSDEAIAAKIEALHEKLRARGKANNPRPARPQIAFKLAPLDADLQAAVDAGADHGEALNTLLLLQILRTLRAMTKPVGPP